MIFTRFYKQGQRCSSYFPAFHKVFQRQEYRGTVTMAVFKCAECSCALGLLQWYNSQRLCKERYKLLFLRNSDILFRSFKMCSASHFKSTGYTHKIHTYNTQTNRNLMCFIYFMFSRC